MFDKFKRSNEKPVHPEIQAQVDEIIKARDNEIAPDIRKHIADAQKQPFIAKTVLCIIYAMFEGLPVEQRRITVKVSKLKFDYSGKTYIILMKGYVKIKKMPWYSFGKQYQAELEYIEGNPLPLAREKSDLKVDAEGINRITSKASRDNLLPSTDSMLMFITLLAIIGMLVALGLAGYMLTDPNGSENLRNAFVSKPNQAPPAGSP